MINTEDPMKSKEMKLRKAKKPGRRKTVLIATSVILAQFLIASFVSLLLVTRGPFDIIRKNLIGTAMTTFSHQYIAKILFSQKQIDEVLNEGKNIKANSQKELDVTPQNHNDPNISMISITSKTGSYSGYLLEISDPLRVKVAYTQFLKKSGENTSSMAERNDAVAAINGGGFTDVAWAGTGAYPSDFVISDGELVYKDQNLSDKTECNVIALNAKGQLIVGDHSLYELQNESVKIMNAVTLSGCQPLVVNGKGTYKSEGSTSFGGIQPRTAIGQKQDGTILMLVLDGRRLNMPGASLYDVQTILQNYGAYTASYLDGGNSSTMYYDGQVINNPSGEFGERPSATAFYVTK